MQKIEQENNTFRANIFFATMEWIILTFLIYALGWLITQLSFFISNRKFVFYLNEIFPSPVTFALLGCIMLFYVYSKIVTVSINRTEVIIKKTFKKPIRLSLDSYKFEPRKEVGNKTLKNEHLYLRTIDTDGYTIDYRLWYFSVNTYTQLISAIQAAHTAALPIEFRSQVAFEDMVTGIIEFNLLRSQIIKSEWILYGKVSGCIIVSALVMFLIRSWGTGLKWYVALITIILAVLSLPILAVKLVLNQRRCPYKIYRNGNFLFLDDTRFSVNEIDKIIMTDVHAKSNSIFPLNRYIKIYANNKKYKYWIGSEGGLKCQDYQELCGEIERMFINSPFKVFYEQK